MFDYVSRAAITKCGERKTELEGLQQQIATLQKELSQNQPKLDSLHKKRAELDGQLNLKRRACFTPISIFILYSLHSIFIFHN